MLHQSRTPPTTHQLVLPADERGEADDEGEHPDAGNQRLGPLR